VSANIVYAKMDSPVGPVWVAKTKVGICALGLGDGQPDGFLDLLSRYVDKEPPRKDKKALTPALTQLREYFSRIRREFDLELDVDGTAFQVAVWNQTSNIPYGATATYGEIADRLERPHAARAVGAALGSNLLPILIPCHRVIGAGDKLVGYRGGVEIKAALLQLEGVLLS
jgi:methylated-DNA-[protein]-cysteine S-methyltransferase